MKYYLKEASDGRMCIEKELIRAYRLVEKNNKAYLFVYALGYSVYDMNIEWVPLKVRHEKFAKKYDGVVATEELINELKNKGYVSFYDIEPKVEYFRKCRNLYMYHVVTDDFVDLKKVKPAKLFDEASNDLLYFIKDYKTEHSINKLTLKRKNK